MPIISTQVITLAARVSRDSQFRNAIRTGFHPCLKRTVCVVIHLRAISQTETQRLRGLPHHAEVSAPGPAVSRQTTISRSTTNRNTAFEVRRHILQRHTRTNGELVVYLPGNVRIKVKDLHFSVHAVVGKFPVALIFSRHTERNRDTEAKPHVFIHLMREEHVGNRHTVLGTVIRISFIRLNIEIEISHHGTHLKLRARQKNHTGRVVPDGGQIVTHDTGAGVGAAQTRHRLFGEHKAARVGCGRGSRRKRECCRKLEHCVLHRNSPLGTGLIRFTDNAPASSCY